MREVRVHTLSVLQAGAVIELDAGAARHVSQVLRMKTGAEIVLFDGRGGEYPAVIQNCSRAGVSVALGEHRAIERESPVAITLWHGLCRGERMDIVIQKATELGVVIIQPVLCERSVVKLDEKRAAKKLAHWRNIAVSACEQSGRNRVPEINQPVPFASLVETAESCAHAVLLHPDGTTSLAAIMRKAGSSMTLCTGPEGGFSDAERAAAQTAGMSVATLGPRILRTETAPLAALAVAQALAGDFAA